MMCCSRIKASITHEEGRVAGIARSMARRQEKGWELGNLPSELAQAKANLAESKRRRDDHDAEHAGTPDVVADLVASA